MRGGWLWLGALALLWGCASQGPKTLEAASAGAGAENHEVGGAKARGAETTRYIDRELGFEIERPGDGWAFSPGHEGPEGITIPVIVVHAETGAQVVVQIAPEVAPPMAFADRLAVGLRTKPGFTTSVPEPTESGSSFRFSMGDAILGTVGISSAAGRLYVLLGTWPKDAPDAVAKEVFQIVASLKTMTLHEASLRSP